jgi:hypothetical protein
LAWPGAAAALPPAPAAAPDTLHVRLRLRSRQLAARFAAWRPRALMRCACVVFSPLCRRRSQVWKNGKKEEELVGANKDNLERMAAKFA